MVFEKKVAPVPEHAYLQKRAPLQATGQKVQTLKIVKEAMHEQEAKFKQIESVLSQIGDKCLQLLKLFYYDGLKMI